MRSRAVPAASGDRRGRSRARRGSWYVEPNGRRSTINSENSGPSPEKRRALKHACRCAEVCDERRGQETVVLDLSDVTPIVDYFVITTATNRRQMHAIAEEVNRVLKDEGSQRMGAEGFESGGWILQDYGDVVLHVFTPETREVYDLEHLWADAGKVEWQTVLEESRSDS